MVTKDIQKTNPKTKNKKQKKSAWGRKHSVATQVWDAAHSRVPLFPHNSTGKKLPFAGN